MAKFSEEQKKVSMALLSGPRAVEELSKELKFPLNALQETLKEMLKLDLVVKQDGFPTKYSLKPLIVEELQRRQKIEEEDKNNIRLKAIIEMIAIEPELLEKTTEKLIGNLKKETVFTVYDIKTHPAMKQEEDYSSYIELNLSAKDFRAIVKFMYFYGPSSVEVIKPSKIELSAQDFQDGLMDMADLIQTYTDYISKMMNRRELENLHQKIISEK